LSKLPAKLYEFHVANLRSLGTAIQVLARAGRASLAAGREYELPSFTGALALLLGVESEARLSKLLHERGGFSDTQRLVIYGQHTQLERWESAIETAFRKHYGVPRAPLTDKVVPHTAYHRYRTLQLVLQHDLAPIINVRNKLAHGQWTYPLNDSCDDVVSELYLALRDETLLKLEIRRNLVNRMAAAVQDLVVSKPAFERDFDKHYAAFADASTRLRTTNYARWCDLLRLKAERGRDQRMSVGGRLSSPLDGNVQILLDHQS
jgi:hypothetical protein